MKKLHLPPINDCADILDFFLGLRESGVILDVDTPFGDYVQLHTMQSVRYFTEDEATLLDAKMQECFNYCHDRNIDIYGIAVTMDGFEEFQKSRKVLETPEEIKVFAESVNIKEPHPFRIHVYDGKWIEESKAGKFSICLHDTPYTGASIREIELFLYSWMDEDDRLELSEKNRQARLLIER